MTKPEHKPWILAVEDDAYIRLLLQYLLKAQFNVVLTCSVDEALRAASRQRFDLFLLDINLQESLTGIDLLNQFRQMPEYSQTPAVACTAYVHQGASERFLAEGFDSYVDKPFSSKTLLSTLQKTLDKAGQLISTDIECRPRDPISGDTLRGVAA